MKHSKTNTQQKNKAEQQTSANRAQQKHTAEQRWKHSKANQTVIQRCQTASLYLAQGCTTFLLLPAALRLLLGITAISEFKIFYILHWFCSAYTNWA